MVALKSGPQGVLLLNAVLTVEAGRPQSHGEQGWSASQIGLFMNLTDVKVIWSFFFGDHMPKKVRRDRPHQALHSQSPASFPALRQSRIP